MILSLRLFLLSLLIACHKASPPPKLALFIPLNGPRTIIGSDVRRAAQMAINYFNLHGGLGRKGHMLSLQIFDTSQERQALVEKVNQALKNDSISVAFGPLYSDVAQDIFPILNAANIPTITNTATLPGLTINRPYIFRSIANDNVKFSALANYLANNGLKRVAIIGTREYFDSELISSLLAHLADYGNHHIAIYTLEQHKEYIDNIMHSIHRAHFEVIISMGLYPEHLKILNSLNSFNFQHPVPLAGVKTFYILEKQCSQKEQNILSQAASQYPGPIIYITEKPNQDQPYIVANRKAFEQLYYDRYAIEASIIAGTTYDSLQFLFSAMVDSFDEHTKKINRKLLRQLLDFHEPYNGLYRTIKFDKNGDLVNNVYVKLYQQGQVTIVAEYKYNDNEVRQIGPLVQLKSLTKAMD